MFRKSHTSSDRPASLPIIPVRPDATLSGAPAASRPTGMLRRTFGRGNPSRRTFGVSHPSRRTFGRYLPSRRTFGISHPSRRTFGISHPSRRTFGLYHP
jgi:hypothetical protein